MSDDAPKKVDPTIEELHHYATVAGADLVLTAAGGPIWWYETDGSLHVAVEYPVPVPGDPNPSGNACSRCGRPWSAATGPGYCSRCDGGAEWDTDDYERRMRRLTTADLRALSIGLAAQEGRDRDLVIIRDELQRREVH